MALGQAWSYVSANPARLMGLSDRGKIAIGARADLVVLNADNLSLMATFAAGRPVWMHPDMATRLLR
jgi:alpha-D-ribose 1-methylphosphonate 5-triphosphate diphosphatase